MNQQKQRLLLEYMLSSPDIFAICDGVIEPAYFDPDLRPIVSLMKDYQKKFSAIPDFDVVAAETGITLTPQSVSRDKIDYCVAEVEDFAKKKAVLHAVTESADLIKDGDFGAIEALLKNALSVSVKKNIGLSLFDDPEAMLLKVAESERPISTGFDDVDKKLFGGLVRKQLVIVSGPSGGGKSVFMNNLSLNFMEAGLTVLFISLELSQELNFLRYAAMTSGLGLNGWFTQIDDMADRVRRYQAMHGNGSRGQLYVTRAPIGSRPSDVRALIKEFELVTGKRPDAVFCDYLDIMGSDVRVPADNISLKDKYAAEGLREIAHDNDLIMVTGSQIKKEAQDSVDIGVSQTAGGQSKVNTADVWGNIMMTSEMKAAGVAGIKWLKTRTSDGVNQVSLMQYNPVSMRLTNFDVPLSDADVKRYASLTQKVVKTTRASSGVEDRGPDQGPELSKPSSGTPVATLLSSMVDIDQ